MTQEKSLPVVLGTGLSGLVGSRIVALQNTNFHWINIDISQPTNPVDITNLKNLERFVSQIKPQALLHCAAFTDVTAAWHQNNDQDGLCYRVNVTGTKHIAQVCQKYHIHLIHLSTAYVFDGQKPSPYLESDAPNPIEWYGQTKLWAEEAVQQYCSDYTILRIDQPFRPDSFSKLDTVHRIITGIQQHTLKPQFTDHFFGPTYIDTLADIVTKVIEQHVTGLYHATNNESWTDYTFATEIAHQMMYEGIIQKGSLRDYLKTANRPYQKNTALNADLLYSTLKYKPDSIKTIISQIVAQQ